MPDESIIRYKKPGFPTLENNGKEHTTRIEYVGPHIDLFEAAPPIGVTWGNYAGVVTSANLIPIPGTEHGELSISMGYYFDQASPAGEGEGQEQETTYEIEWVLVSRSTLEHPKFAIGLGGSYALTSEDVCAIEQWKNEEDVTQKKVFGYKEKPDDSTWKTLSTNAKMFARGVQLGVETWDDFAPVVRVTTGYINGKPPRSQAGQKDNPPAAAEGPTGYEWRKSAERNIKAGGQNRWERVEEWLGAKKVLIDKDEVFWSAPT